MVRQLKRDFQRQQNQALGNLKRGVGLALAKGQTIEDAKAQIGQEVEGINTAREVRAKAQELDVEMPITEQTYQVLFGGLSPQQAVQNLLSRQTRSE